MAYGPSKELVKAQLLGINTRSLFVPRAISHKLCNTAIRGARVNRNVRRCARSLDPPSRGESRVDNRQRQSRNRLGLPVLPSCGNSCVALPQQRRLIDPDRGEGMVQEAALGDPTAWETVTRPAILGGCCRGGTGGCPTPGVCGRLGRVCSNHRLEGGGERVTRPRYQRRGSRSRRSFL